MRFVLASKSASRRAMLTAAGVPFEAVSFVTDDGHRIDAGAVWRKRES